MHQGPGAPCVPAGFHSAHTPRMLHICGCIETWWVCKNKTPFFTLLQFFPLHCCPRVTLWCFIPNHLFCALCQVRIISGAVSPVRSELLRVIFKNALLNLLKHSQCADRHLVNVKLLQTRASQGCFYSNTYLAVQRSQWAVPLLRKVFRAGYTTLHRVLFKRCW